MEKTHSKLILYVERIEKFITNVLKTGKEKRTEEFLKARIQLIHSYWKQFQETHDNMYEAATDEQLKSFDTEAYYDVENLYMEAVGWLHDQINEQKPKSTDDKETLSNSNTSSFIQPKQLINNLPKLNIPTFLGSYLEWPSFRATFQSLIHENESISQIQKMHYLKSAVSGEAETLIKHLSITSQNYISAWGILVARYENKRVLVNSNLKILLSLQKMSTESFNEIRRVLDGFTQAVTQLKNLDRPVSYWDDWLVFLLSHKLDPTTRKDWENSISQSTEVPAFNSLCDFLASRLHTLQALSDNPISAPKLTNVKHGYVRPANTYPRSYYVSSGRPCLCCQGQHLLLFCPQFRAKTINDRFELLRRNNSCYNCLSSRHSVQECPSMNRCKHCKQKHHTMIHGHHNNVSSSSTAQSNQTSVCPIASPTRAHLSSSNYTPRRVLLTTASILVQSPEGRIVRARALLDQGSESSFITASLANTLRLRKSPIRIPVLGVGGCNAGTAEAFATHNILTSSDPACVITIQSLILPTLAHLIPARKIQKSTWPHIMDLQLADPEFHTPSRIDLILGADVYSKVLLDEVRRGPDGTPLAQATSLGWILFGSVDDETTTNHIMLQSHCALVDVDRTLRRFWEIEDTTHRVPLTPEEEECENIFLHSHKRDSDGRYIVRLPTKSNAPPLGDSRKVAMSALLRLEKRFTQDTDLHSNYSDFLSEYITLGHMEPVNHEQENACRQFYLPHHAVFKPSSTTTKLRVVFNGSQKTSSGLSLNDLLHIGPKLQNDIFHVISNWRLYPLVFTADIEKMYRQIRVHTDDIDLQRILWRRNTQEPIECYRLLTVTYGMACAPYLACRTLLQLSNDYQHDLPSAAKVVRENFYVDDALFGAYDYQSASHIKQEVRTLLSKGGFKLRKWLTNSSELIHDIPEEDRELKSQVKIVEDAQVKTLGLGWNPSQDKFIFQIHLPQQDSVTKRNILSDISRIYDPLGWLSPTTIIAKVFLQKLWLAKLDWDDELPEELSIKWNHYRREMNQLNCIQIARWMGTTDPHKSTMNLQLHGFCDASLSAYSAVVYLRITSDHGDTRVSLVASKTRVSPLKTVSLPRLELCGAALLADLISTVQHEPYFSKITVHAWSDSTIVLTWLGEHPSRWKQHGTMYNLTTTLLTAQHEDSHPLSCSAMSFGGLVHNGSERIKTAGHSEIRPCLLIAFLKNDEKQLSSPPIRKTL